MNNFLHHLLELVAGGMLFFLSMPGLYLGYLFLRNRFHKHFTKGVSRSVGVLMIVLHLAMLVIACYFIIVESQTVYRMINEMPIAC